MQILVQSPADIVTDLQVTCLFRSSPVSSLRGLLAEIDKKRNGLLDRIRKPELFCGELGETLLIAPPENSLGGKRLLLTGPGRIADLFPGAHATGRADSLEREASNLGEAHPFIAPTIFHGGVTKFTTGQIAQEVVTGFLRAHSTDNVIQDANASAGQPITAFDVSRWSTERE